MRFMMLVMPKDYANVKPDRKPDPKEIEKMMAFNRELTAAGVLVSLDGLHPPSAGARVTWHNGKPRVTDGPFSESKELIGGYWVINVKSKAEALEWATKVPFNDGDMLEVRQIQEMTEFPPEIQKLAEGVGPGR